MISRSSAMSTTKMMKFVLYSHIFNSSLSNNSSACMSCPSMCRLRTRTSRQLSWGVVSQSGTGLLHMYNLAESSSALFFKNSSADVA